MEFMRNLDILTPVQVIEEPKILPDSIPQHFCGASSSAEGGTVGGSADGVVLRFAPAADNGAEC